MDHVGNPFGITFAPIWLHFGPTWAPVAPFWCHLCLPSRSESPQKSPQDSRKLARRSPESPRIPPRTPFGTILAHFLSHSEGLLVALGVVWGHSWEQTFCMKLGSPVAKSSPALPFPSALFFFGAPRGSGSATWIQTSAGLVMKLRSLYLLTCDTSHWKAL